MTGFKFKVAILLLPVRGLSISWNFMIKPRSLSSEWDSVWFFETFRKWQRKLCKVGSPVRFSGYKTVHFQNDFFVDLPEKGQIFKIDRIFFHVFCWYSDSSLLMDFVILKMAFFGFFRNDLTTNGKHRSTKIHATSTTFVYKTNVWNSEKKIPKCRNWKDL